MDVNVWSTFKKGGRSVSVAPELPRILPSQRLKQKYEKSFSSVITTPPKPSEEGDIESKLKTVFELLQPLALINSLSKEDVREILEVFETDVFIDENHQDILKRAKLLSESGLLPDIIEGETTGGVKYNLRESPPKRVPFNIAASEIKRRVTQRLRKRIDSSKYNLKSSLKQKLPRLSTISREDVETVPDRTPEEKEKILSLIQESIFERNSMSKITKLVFEELPVRIFAEEQKRQYRRIYEFSEVESQCNNTIGKFDLTNESGERKFPGCYICGFKFYEDKDEDVFKKASDKTRDELRATCEHILPIIQAAFFLQLYRSDINMDDPVIKRELDLEYSWAHRCCNYEKGDLSFLAMNIQQGKPVSFMPNKQVVSAILSGIANTENTRVGLNVLQKQIVSTDAWINTRKDILQSMIVDIVDYLNSRGNIGVLFALGYDKITNSAALSQKFINAIGEAKKRIIKNTSIKLILDKETGQSVSGTIPVPVLTEYQKAVKMQNGL